MPRPSRPPIISAAPARTRRRQRALAALPTGPVGPREAGEAGSAALPNQSRLVTPGRQGAKPFAGVREATPAAFLGELPLGQSRSPDAPLPVPAALASWDNLAEPGEAHPDPSRLAGMGKRTAAPSTPLAQAIQRLAALALPALHRFDEPASAASAARRHPSFTLPHLHTSKPTPLPRRRP